MIENTMRIDEVRLQNPPKIPGLRFRRFRGEEDYPHMLAVIEGSKQADGIQRTDSLEEIQTGYAHLVNCNPFQDMLFAEVHGEVIGYNRVTWRRETKGDHIYVNFGFLLPAWRRRGIGRAMQRHSEARLREIAQGHPRDADKYLESFAADTAAGDQHLLENAGYQPVRYAFQMSRPTSGSIPETSLPEGLAIRETNMDQIRLVWDAMDEAFQDHWGHAPHTEEDFQHWQERPIFDPSLWKVAWSGEQVAGMVLNYVDHEENQEYQRLRGYTEDICVRIPWRRLGLARHLIAESIRLHRSLGMREVALGVDTQNATGALRLYEGMGYTQVKRFTTYRKPLHPGT